MRESSANLEGGGCGGGEGVGLAGSGVFFDVAVEGAVGTVS